MLMLKSNNMHSEIFNGPIGLYSKLEALTQGYFGGMTIEMYRVMGSLYKLIRTGHSLLYINSQKACHFAVSLIFLTASFFTPIAGYAGESCKQFYLASQSVSNLGTQESEKVFYREIGKRQIRKSEIRKLFDKAALGFLGELFDLKWDPIAKKIVLSENLGVKEYKIKAISDLLERSHSSERSVRKDSIDFIERIVGVENITDQTILVKTKNIVVGGEESEVARAVRNHFNLLYIRMVNWNYRFSGLEKNKTITSMVMMDEIALYAKNNQAFNFNLLFDKKIWEMYLLTLSVQLEDYNRAETQEQKELILGHISNGSMPFLPFAGVSWAKDILDTNAPAELKRYFKNDIEDPLDLASTTDKNEFSLRHKMLYRVIESLPEKSSIEIHAHSMVHVKAYAKLGFKKSGIIENKKYPGIKIYLLKAQREEALDKISTILNKMQ